MFSFFRKRDATLYPADDVGDALYALMRKGDSDATIGIDFTLAFASEADAKACFDEVANPAHDPEVQAPANPGGGWMVETLRETEPRYLPVKAAIERMRETAARHRGTLSDWRLFW